MTDLTDNPPPPKVRRLSFWLLIFGVSFLVSLGLCGISLQGNDIGVLAVLSTIGMVLSLAGFVITLAIATFTALIKAVKR